MPFPYAEVQFDSTGSVRDPAEQRRAVDLIAAAGVSDVLVLAHGWNNDMPAARDLYRRLMAAVEAVRPAVPSAASVRLAVVGVLWPSIRWADPDLIAGGGVSIGDPVSLLRVEIENKIPDGETADGLAALVPALAESPDARARFLGLLRDLLPAVRDEDGPPVTLLEGDPQEVFEQAGWPLLIPPGADEAGGATGLADGTAGLRLPGDVWRAARNLLNVTTYFTMKDRAGRVGMKGVARLLDALAVAVPGVRRHLAGHSFGARLVSAAAMDHRPVHSITLLQGAFSHHGFATGYDGPDAHGFFRSVVASGGLTGPLVITHTARDLAVGVAYALISRLAGQRASGLPGGPGDPYGGIGRNGALKTPQVSPSPNRLLPVGQGYGFAGGRAYNLLSDAFITSHGDVAGAEAANALLQAVAAPPRR